MRIDSEELSYRQIEQHFRNQLEMGVLKAGDKLPSNAELAKEFNVSGWTIQNALSRLAAEGLLGRARRRGTFVKGSDNKALICVLFGPSLADETAYFYRAVLKALREEMSDQNWNCRFYDGLTDNRGKPVAINSVIFQQLQEDFRNYSFKGIIQFATGAKELEVLDGETKIPRVVFSHPETDVTFDRERFIKESVGFLIKKGRKKIAFLRSVWPGPVKKGEDEIRLAKAAVAAGLPPPQIERVILTEHIGRQEVAIYQQCVEIVARWNRAAADAPDALLVSDDILTRPMAMALLNGGISVPRQLTVVSLANEGVYLNYGLPVVRYEFSPTEIARELLVILKSRLLGRAVPPLPVLCRGRIVEANEQDVENGRGRVGVATN